MLKENPSYRGTGRSWRVDRFLAAYGLRAAATDKCVLAEKSNVGKKVVSRRCESSVASCRSVVGASWQSRVGAEDLKIQRHMERVSQVVIQMT